MRPSTGRLEIAVVDVGLDALDGGHCGLMGRLCLEHLRAGRGNGRFGRLHLRLGRTDGGVVSFHPRLVVIRFLLRNRGSPGQHRGTLRPFPGRPEFGLALQYGRPEPPLFYFRSRPACCVWT